MAFLEGSLAGPGYVILNAIRVMNIVVLLSIIAASAVMIVRIDIVNSFFFFDAATHVITAGISIFLIISELPIFRRYFDHNWPLLGQESGFVTLALAMVILGVTVLGDLNTPAASQEALSLPFWRIVVSSGILAMVLGVLNFVASFIFRDRANSLSARHVRSYGAVAPQKVTRSSSQKSFRLSLNRENTFSSYRTASMSSRTMSMRPGARFPVKISSPTNPTPWQDTASSKYSSDPEIAAPDLAHHPAMRQAHV
ncbi:hypothetical protein M432DRAFT_58010 [Thermoascus aurantiacus ATCC 26904]